MARHLYDIVHITSTHSNDFELGFSPPPLRGPQGGFLGPLLCTWIGGRAHHLLIVNAHIMLEPLFAK